MTDKETLIHAIDLREKIARRNHQGFVDIPFEMVGNVLALLKEQEAKIGHWIDTTKVIGFPRVECSVCGSGQGAIWMDYCPFCGAKMEGR